MSDAAMNDGAASAASPSAESAAESAAARPPAPAASPAAAAAAVASPAAERLVQLILKWNGQTIHIQMKGSETMEDLRALVQMETEVRPENQKIFGLRIKGRTGLPDDATITDASPKDGQVIKMMGSSDETISEIEAEAAQLAAEEDGIDKDLGLDWDALRAAGLSEEARAHVAAAHARLNETIPRTVVNVMNPPRDNKKLLVLDLDHTLLDFSRRERATSSEDFKRPYMDEFLKSCYKHYDLVIWSQTKWHWVEIKITEMGMINNPDFAICFALDRTCMFKVHNEVRPHEVKALEIIWRKFPDRWSPKNTLHIDDLARNFVMNPKNGLKCSAYSRRRSRAAQDRELLELAAYLESIALTQDDFTRLDHSKWRDHLQKLVNKRS